MYDILLCSIPFSNLESIYSAPAILKGIVQAEGYTAKTKDFGTVLLNLCNKDEEVFHQIQNYFISPSRTLTNQQMLVVHKLYDYVVEYIRKNPTRFLGFSVFSIYTHKATYELCQRIKQQLPNQRIVLGGRGCQMTTYSSVCEDLSVTGIDKTTLFGSLLIQRGLADDLVLGDGEDAILELLEKDQLTNVVYSTDTFSYPIPNYDDYDFDDYLFDKDKVSLPITGSKGCVRDCDFCNVKAQFGKYRYRSGKDIADEMISISKKLGYRKFQFTDSLVNGGLKPFREFCTVLAEYNDQNPNQKITWNGQYICRPAEHVPDDIYPLMARAGAHGLTIGAESGSNNVLRAINKKTTVEELYSELEQFQKHGITCSLLTMTGHWSETHEDFLDHCRMFFKILPYVRSGTISSVGVGLPMFFLDDTPAMNNAANNHIIFSDFDQANIWYKKDSDQITYKQKVYRWGTVVKLCQKLRIPIQAHVGNLSVITGYINANYKKINEFYESVVYN